MYNTKGDTSAAPDEIRALFDYIEKGRACDILTNDIDRAVCRIRTNEEWRIEYMKTFTHEMDVQHYAYIDGFEEGREDGFRQGIEQGRSEVYCGTIAICREFGQTDEQIITTLISKFNL